MKPSREAWISRDTLLGLSNEIRLFLRFFFSPVLGSFFAPCFSAKKEKERSSMKRRKWMAFLLSVLMLLSMLALSACDDKKNGQETEAPVPSVTETKEPEPSKESIDPDETEPEETEPEEQGIIVTDMTGRTIVLEKPAEKVVALTASNCEILYALGAGDTVVGRGEYCDYPAEVLDVPAVQSGKDTNIEQIIALEPDVLFMSTMAQTEEQVKQLENAGIAVIVSDAQDINGVYESIALMGKVMGKDKEAEEIVSSMKASFAELAEKATGDGSKSVYFEVSPLEYGLWTAGSGTFMDEVAELIGLKNCFHDVNQWGEISEEQVLERNPDYIVTITMYFGEGPRPEEEIAGREGWGNLTAVKNNAILHLPNNELSRPVPRLVEGAQKLFDLVYGEADSSDKAA
jgi:iron complex transport system substrate-binding protein